MMLAVNTFLILFIGSFVQTPLVADASSSPPPITLAGSVPPQVSTSRLLGHYNPQMQVTIGLLLYQTHQSDLRRLIQQLYSPTSSLYHHWLKPGQFNARFGPSSKDVTAAKNFLTQSSLKLQTGSPSPLLILAVGRAGQMESAFHTTINSYQLQDGTIFFANAQPLKIPATLGKIVQGVLGLTNAPSAQPLLLTPDSAKGASPDYGGGPNGGLTPSQIQSIYDANQVYSSLNDQGQGIVLGLYELSGYNRQDILKYEAGFGLPNVPIVDKLTGNFFTKTLFFNHSGAGEVELDIEMALALAPKIAKIIVYEAPNFILSSASEYMQIAQEDLADTVSTSWGSCETGTFGFERSAENDAFTQMAVQGQSMFAASGDTGAFACKTFFGSVDSTPHVQDPASQPLVTAVGGTSFQGVTDPGTTNPPYPAGMEHVWNNNCTPSTCDQMHGSGSGGGSSDVWPALILQRGPGVNESGFSQSGSACGQPAGTLCREVPDVSMDADPNTGYAVYCTDGGDKDCKNAAANMTNPGWTVFGGTSAGAPLWAAIAALIDSLTQQRMGLATLSIYSLLNNSSAYAQAFHDTQPVKGFPTDNGHYPTQTAYDMATGVGTPDIYQFVLAEATQTHGAIWITGHDADFHCSVDLLQCHYLQVALNFVMNGSTLPVLALDHGNEVATAISQAFGSSAPTVITVDPRSGFATLPILSSSGAPLYSAIVVASDFTCGGCDNNDDLGVTPDSDVINARVKDFLQFYAAGGGILGLAGAANSDIFYKFLPVSSKSTEVSSPFTLTPIGLSLGLIEGDDDNCCPTHNSFFAPSAHSPYEIAELDAAGLPETLVIRAS